MIVNFLGRTHILLLHLPIGILVLAIILEWMKYFNWTKINRNILSLTYGSGLVFALISCMTGYLLFKNGDYPSELTNNHKWAGIITTLLCGVSYWASRIEKKQILLVSSLFLMLGLGVTGHLGGSITHGEDFLAIGAIKETKNKRPIYNIEDAENAFIYSDVIVPLLDAKCVSCHGPSKVKGKLRMDSPEALAAGGKSKKEILGDGVSSSEMLRRINLPISDEKHMPPKKKLQVDENELAFLTWWITNGAPFDAKVGDLADHHEMTVVLEKMLSNQGIISNEQAIVPSYLPEVDVPEPSEKSIRELIKSNVVVLAAGDNSPFLEINLVNIESPTTEIINNLESLAPNVIRLKLSDLSLTNQQASFLSKMDNIVRLYLDGNSIGDEAMVHLKTKKHLKYLNLNNTAVTDSGLHQLDSIPSDATIFTYNTAITIDSLKSGAKVIRGGFQLENLSSDTIRVSQK